jgi:glycosyltransferase family protein
LNIIQGGNIHFQEYNAALRERLIQILQMPETPGIKVAIPIMINSLDNLTEESRSFWTMNMQTGRMHWHRLCAKKEFLDSTFTWTYLVTNDKKEGIDCLSLLPKVWDNQDVLLVEGGGKMAVSLHFMNNARSIQRIICPSSNAFLRYDEILQCVKRHYSGQLVLLSLGPTASVLAYDLFLEGIRAIDLGHINRCYQAMDTPCDSSCVMTEEMYERQILVRV